MASNQHSDNGGSKGQGGHSGHHNIPIFIDDEKYEAPQENMTGAELRNLAKPPVPEDRDLWLEVLGRGDDELIRPEGQYEVKPGSHYYTAPATINPGGAK